MFPEVDLDVVPVSIQVRIKIIVYDIEPIEPFLMEVVGIDFVGVGIVIDWVEVEPLEEDVDSISVIMVTALVYAADIYLLVQREEDNLIRKVTDIFSVDHL